MIIAPLYLYLHLLPLHPAIALVGGPSFYVPGTAGVALGHDAVDFDELQRAADKLQLTLATPPLAGGADLSGYRYIVHPVASFHLDARMLHQQKASPHCVSAEATGMPERRTQCGDERTRGQTLPPACVSTTCANSYQRLPVFRRIGNKRFQLRESIAKRRFCNKAKATPSFLPTSPSRIPVVNG